MALVPLRLLSLADRQACLSVRQAADKIVEAQNVDDYGRMLRLTASSVSIGWRLDQTWEYAVGSSAVIRYTALGEHL